MNTTTNQNYNVIKGLQIFINDIRECTTREAESKRVESELDKIRKKFNSTSSCIYFIFPPFVGDLSFKEARCLPRYCSFCSFLSLEETESEDCLQDADINSILNQTKPPPSTTTIPDYSQCVSSRIHPSLFCNSSVLSIQNPYLYHSIRIKGRRRDCLLHSLCISPHSLFIPSESTLSSRKEGPTKTCE